VLKVCLESMRKEAGLPFDLMVFDNGSCAQVRDFLISEKDAGRIQYLILSERNMGKGGAWNVIFAARRARSSPIPTAMCLFSPTWLSRSVQVLETFPNTGMVTARPFRSRPSLSARRLLGRRKRAMQNWRTGHFIPWETFLEFNLSLGQTEEENRKVYAETKDWRIQF